MLTIDKFQTLILTLSFVVPGFIIHSIFSMCRPRRTEIKELLYLRFLAFSVLNLIVCIWPIRYVIVNNYVSLHPLRSVGIFFVIAFISPLILGVIIAKLDSTDWMSKLLRRLKLYPMHATPNSWDYKFGKICARGDAWVLVRMTSGKVVGGYFGPHSFASTDVAERDLYLQSVWEVNSESGEWTRKELTDGIWIKASEILSVEFKHASDPQENDNGRQEDSEQAGSGSQPESEGRRLLEGAPTADGASTHNGPRGEEPAPWRDGSDKRATAEQASGQQQSGELADERHSENGEHGAKPDSCPRP
jgi:hypothetical protein